MVVRVTEVASDVIIVGPVAGSVVITGARNVECNKDLNDHFKKEDDLRKVASVVTTGAAVLCNLAVVVSGITMLAVGSDVFPAVEVAIGVPAVGSCERNVLY